jgi:K+-transporting ATPase KdpF subunit
MMPVPEYVLSGAVAVALFVYLVYALLYPERF